MLEIEWFLVRNIILTSLPLKYCPSPQLIVNLFFSVELGPGRSSISSMWSNMTGSSSLFRILSEWNVEGQGQIALPQGLIMHCNLHERVVHQQTRNMLFESSTNACDQVVEGDPWSLTFVSLSSYSFLSVTLIFLLTINVITQGQGGQCMRREITCESWRKTQVKNGSL